MRVKALRLNYYTGKEYKPGDSYEMDDREAVAADILERIGVISIIKNEPPAQAAPVVERTTQFPDAAIVKKEPLDIEPAFSQTPIFAGSDSPPARKRYYRKREGE